MDVTSPFASFSPTRLPTAHVAGYGKDDFSEVLAMSWPKDNTSREQELLTAWAILLRAYSLSDLVAFEVSKGEHSGTEQTKISESSRKDHVAMYRWRSSMEIGQCSGKEHNPLVTVLLKSQLPATEDMLNTAVFVDRPGPIIQANIDFVVKVMNHGRFEEMKLCVRNSRVSEKFGRAVGATLKHIISMCVDGYCKFEKITLSTTDQAYLHKFTQNPVTNHPDCMHHLVRNRVIQNPTAEAVCAWDGTMTYAELDSFAEAVARQLVFRGVKVGEYVPFAFEKSLWSVVAVLAILKAGAAFVPIDPTQPVARLQGILSDVDAKMILVSKSLEQKFSQLVQQTLVVSTENVTLSPRCDGLNYVVLPEVNPQDIAFVLFTSGSTGKPKGMVMQHGAYSTHTICHGIAMGYEKARVLQFAAHTFDVYVMDVFATLSFGGCVCIPSEDDRRLNIVKVFNDFQIDLAILTPSFAHVLEPSLIPNLRTLAVGGEALKRETVQKWTTEAPGVSLMQIYGPAEVGICILGSLSQESSSPEVIGYPLDNSMCLLVDPDDVEKLVPVGAVGELVVSGPTMLREYLNNPGKTEASFVDDPKWATELSLPHRRFYKSGDLLRHNVERMDGSFDFVGRKDSQVKYHGQRMELEDVEHHLSSIESISACMVSIPKEGSLKGKLVAVVQLESSDKSRVKHEEPMTLVHNSELGLGKMREHLSERLPGYMIPNALLVVQNIPFTPSLKLDRPRTNAWVAGLNDSLVTDVLIRQISCDVLSPNETTAHILSHEYARLVGGKDRRHRAAFESHNFCLQAGGIDSIQIIRLSNFVQKTWRAYVPMSMMLSSWATIRDVAASIDSNNVGNKDLERSDPLSVDSEAHALTKELIAAIKLPSVQPVIKNVLLTGATGFLGIEILHNLLEQDMKVIAVIRGRSKVVAWQRLVDKARAANWWKDRFVSKLEVWLGNLSQFNIGLDNVYLERIQGNCAPIDRIHAIIHNGAKVHYALDYTSLKEVNVSSTIELLKLTAKASTSLQSFVYVSGGQQLSFVEEQEFHDAPNELGYTRSKLVSEAVVGRCMQYPEFHGTSLSIVKPGYIIGNPKTGEANMTDFLWRLVASCVEVGSYDADNADRWLFVADQTRVASSVVDSALRKHLQPVSRVLDGLRFMDLWHILTNEFSYDLKPLPYPEWIYEIKKRVAEKQDRHVMFPLMHMLEKGEAIGTLGGPLAASNGVKDSIRANIRYLIEAAYLPITGEYMRNGNVTPDSEVEGTTAVHSF